MAEEKRNSFGNPGLSIVMSFDPFEFGHFSISFIAVNLIRMVAPILPHNDIADKYSLFPTIEKLPYMVTKEHLGTEQGVH